MLATAAFSRGLATTRSETVETQNETASETTFGLISISEACYNTREKIGGFPRNSDKIRWPSPTLPLCLYRQSSKKNMTTIVTRRWWQPTAIQYIIYTMHNRYILPVPYHEGVSGLSHTALRPQCGPYYTGTSCGLSGCSYCSQRQISHISRNLASSSEMTREQLSINDGCYTSK